MASLLISFQGLDAADGHVEAFAGIESAAGIARSLTLIAHYAATGTVRYRFPFDDTVKLYLEGTESGSFNWKVTLQCAGALALGLSTNAIYDLSKLVLTKAIGEEPTHLSPEVDQLNKDRSGDIDALVEAVEPALKKGHYGIGETATKIVITTDKKEQIVVTFDKNSKQYLLDSEKDARAEQDVSISAINANDRTGRAYFLDLERTIPFTIARDADANTIVVLSAGLNRYVNKNPAPTLIRFTPIRAIDGRLKRIIIHGAEDVSSEE